MDSFIELQNMFRIKQWLKNLLVFSNNIVPFETSISSLVSLLSTFFLFSSSYNLHNQ